LVTESLGSPADERADADSEVEAWEDISQTASNGNGVQGEQWAGTRQQIEVEFSLQKMNTKGKGSSAKWKFTGQYWGEDH